MKKLQNYWNNDIVDVEMVEDQVITLKFIVGKSTLNVISSYVPQFGSLKHLKVKF